jgi:PST family polysaccharide transporter
MKRAALLAILWSMGESWGFKIVSAIVFLLLARIVAPDAFGLVALAQVYLAAIQILCDQGFATALIQRATLDAEHKDSAFWANLAIGILLMVLTLFLAGSLAQLFGEPKLALVLRWYSLVPLLSSLTIVQDALAQRELRYKALALRQTAGALAGGIVGIGMAFAGEGILALIAQSLIGQTMAALVLWGIVDWRPRFAFSRRHFIELFSFGIKALATDVLVIISGYADRLLMGYFLGATAVGYYSSAQRLILIAADLVGGSSQGIVLPLFSRIQHDKARIARGLRLAQGILTMTVTPAAVGLAVIAPSLVPLALGQRWNPSILPVQILAFGLLAQGFSFFFGYIMTAVGHPQIRLCVTAARSLTLCALILVGTRYGVPGIALAVTATHIIFYGIELAVMRRLVPFSVPTYLCELFKPALAAAAMAAAVVHLDSFVNIAPVFLLVLKVLLGIAVYGVILLIFARSRIYRIVNLFTEKSP